MHVAIVGCGALGSVYGARLAAHADVDVSFVVRRPIEGPVRLERVDGDRASLEIGAPRWGLGIPGDADVLLLCVAATDLDERLLALLQQHDVPIVTMTPLLPREHALLERMFLRRLLPGMPSILAYRNEAGVTRYWLPRVAETLIEEPRPLIPEVDALVRALNRAGFAARLQLGTYEINAATTVTFLPVAFALDVAGSVDALFADAVLVRLGLAAAREGRALADSLGKPAPWADAIARFGRPTMLKIGVGLAKRRSPEAVAYVEHHFGRKMHEQNVAMSREIAALARERGLSHAALDELAERLGGRAPP